MRVELSRGSSFLWVKLSVSSCHKGRVVSWVKLFVGELSVSSCHKGQDDF